VPIRRKTLITVCDHKPQGRQGKPPRLFPKTGYPLGYTGYPLGYPEPALQQKTEERERENNEQTEMITD